MNAIPYFDYSLAPFWPSYQNKVIGVLERALREQSGSRIRRILLRLPWEHDNAFNSRQTWFGMDFIETVSALMNAKPGRDLCWLLTRHPEKPEYHVVLCVRQEYFDGPELDRLILDAWSNVLGFASPGEAKPYQKQITRDVVLDRRSPDCEALFKDLIWAFSDFARDRRGVCDPGSPLPCRQSRLAVLKAARHPIPRITPFFINLTEDILTMLTTTSHDSVWLRADDPLIDMNYITSFTGMTDKWFYRLISEGHFPKPIKLGRSSRWYKSEVEQWMQQRIEESRGAAA